MSEGKIEENTVILYRGTKPLTAMNAAGSLPGDGVFILAYTPDFCGFVTFKDEKLTGPDGEVIAPDSVFELRCFCGTFELRWVREAADGRGNGVLVSERQIEGWAQEPAEFSRRSGHYLLWGKGIERGGKVRLFEHRVGDLPLPDETEKNLNAGGRAWLIFDEYFSPDEYGNMVWRLERLKGLEAE